MMRALWLIASEGEVQLERMLHGQLTKLADEDCTTTGAVDLRVAAFRSDVKVYVGDVLKITGTGELADLNWGHVGVSGWQAIFEDLAAGISTNDDDLDDGADTVVLKDTFDGKVLAPTYDANGNLTEDADYAYTYNAWNNLVKVAPKEDDENPFATYAYFADNRRAGKTVTGRGDLDGTVLFYYDGQKVIEERNGSGDVLQQYIWGPNHIDELVMIRGENGAYWAFEDANWNLMGLTDASGRVAEEYHYDPYGKMTATRYIAFGDATGDGDVDTADDTAFAAADDSDYDDGNFNRMFDADWDGHIDAFDEAAFDANYELPGDSIIAVARDYSPNGNPYGYTTRRLDPESGLMHYRARTYNTELRQFVQRDPLGYHDELSMYIYARGLPLGWRDPLGQQSVRDHSWRSGSNSLDEAERGALALRITMHLRAMQNPAAPENDPCDPAGSVPDCPSAPPLPQGPAPAPPTGGVQGGSDDIGSEILITAGCAVLATVICGPVAEAPPCWAGVLVACSVSL